MIVKIKERGKYMKTMTVKEFISFFKSELEIKVGKHRCAIIDNQLLNTKENNYGIHYMFKKEDDIDPFELIPDIYFEGEIDFLFYDDFPNHYKVPNDKLDELIQDCCRAGFDHLDNVCLKYGLMDVYNDYKEICQVLRKEIKLIV